MAKIKDRTGEIRQSNEGYEMKIISYRGTFDIDVLVNDEVGTVIRNASYGNLKKGNIKNPNHKSVYGVGYFGIGKHKARIDNIKTEKYKVWWTMMQRCYSTKAKSRSRNSSYGNCTVCDEWHNFQNFGDWYDTNYYQLDCETMHLDKDILFKGNKIYSPETCVFVPEKINSIFEKSLKARGEYPIGVSYHKRDNIFEANCNNGITGTQKYLGRFSTPHDAFNSYKKYKEDLIKQLANIYYGKIPHNVYTAMMNYSVDITD